MTLGREEILLGPHLRKSVTRSLSHPQPDSEGALHGAHDPALPEILRNRLQVAHATASANVAAISDRMGRERHQGLMGRLKALIAGSEPTWIRLRALYKLIEEQIAFNENNVACRKGCAHCCHIAVSVARPEAQMMGMALKLRPKTVGEATNPERFDFGYHNPCPFLKDNECSIYEHRPLACRVHFNADEDPLLCELRPPLTISVPYLDARNFQLAYIMICEGAPLADIRDYFPAKAVAPPKGSLGA